MKVKFVPQNIEIDIKPNESVLHAAQSHGVHIQSICKGVPSCTECRVRVLDGEFNVFPPNQKEITLIGNSFFVDQRRLSCQLKCFGNITVDLTEQVEKAEQSSQSKRPRGARSEYDAATSQAKHGNIIFEGEASPDAAIANAPVEAEVPADERMVKYESNLQRAETELFAEETKRQLQQLKSRGGSTDPGPRSATGNSGPRSAAPGNSGPRSAAGARPQNGASGGSGSREGGAPRAPDQRRDQPQKSRNRKRNGSSRRPQVAEPRREGGAGPKITSGPKPNSDNDSK